MLEFSITASSQKGGKAVAIANKLQIELHTNAGRSDTLPNPLELLLTALAACFLKSVERYSEILKYPYRSVKIKVTATREEIKPSITGIEYVLEVDTDIDKRQLENWHKNIIKFGTINNTISKGTDLKGSIGYLNK